MNLTADWVCGFVDGEGCFFVGIQKNPTVRIGFQVIPEFRVVQHQRDLEVLRGLKEFFGFGRVCRNHGDRWEFRVRRFNELRQVVLFFKRYRLRTKKQSDADRFDDVLQIMEKRRHLTRDGLDEIKRIALTMNTGNRRRLVSLLDDLRE